MSCYGKCMPTVSPYGPAIQLGPYTERYPMTSLLERTLARATTPKTLRAARKAKGGPAKVGKTQQFLAWLRDYADSEGLHGTPIGFLYIARIWCDGDNTITPPIPAHYPTGADGSAPRSPEATLSSTVGTLAEHGDLPPGVRLLSLDDVRAMNKHRVAAGLAVWREERSIMLMPLDADESEAAST